MLLRGAREPAQPVDVRELANSGARLQLLSWTLTLAALALVIAFFAVGHSLVLHLQPDLGVICARQVLDGPLCP
ncbi:MAG: hypothetical protein ACRDHX_10795 [Chloroflexota bacterium]